MLRRKVLLSLAIILTALLAAACMSSSAKNISSQKSDVPLPEEIIQKNHPITGEAEIYLAGGCFWGTEFLMRNVAGVTSVEVGYANGPTRNPNYRQVCKGSGHAESAHVIYNKSVISLPKLLKIYYKSIDPTRVNHQGNDVGINYRTGIYFSDPADESIIKESLLELQSKHKKDIVVECMPIKNFYRAEENHQEYLIKNPNGYCHVAPGVIDEQAKAKAAHEFKDKNFSRDRVYGKPDRDVLRSLSDLQRAVTQEAATEPPFKNEYDEEFREGIYVDVTNGQPLFASKDKFESSCGWPAFSKPIDKNFIEERKDLSFGMDRTEVRAKASGAHLGHVFEDAPEAHGGTRYCINSAALRFIPREKMKEEGYGEWLDLFKP